MKTALFFGEHAPALSLAICSSISTFLIESTSFSIFSKDAKPSLFLVSKIAAASFYISLKSSYIVLSFSIICSENTRFFSTLVAVYLATLSEISEIRRRSASA